MIVTRFRQKVSPKATVINSGKGTVLGSAYTGFKHVASTYGFYQDIKPYLPETYLDKYRYKPRKRIAGYIGQTVYKKALESRQYNKFGKAHRACDNPNSFDKCRENSSKSRYGSK